ncbi:ketopantoate reductase family protein [Aeromicrobium sp. P5_D10]
MSPRYVIVGAGAIGASLAAQLHESGVPYLLVARPRQLALLRDQGLRYVRPGQEVTLTLDVTSAEEIDALDPDDVVVFTPKSQDLEAALDDWAWRSVKGGTVVADLPVVTVQNGLAAEPLALRRYATVLGASVHQPGRYVEPGVVEVRSAPTVGLVLVGAFPAGHSELAQQVADDWGRSGYAVQATDNIVRWKASKLLWNVNNAVDVLTGAPDAVARLKQGLVDEARAVLTAAGIDIADPSERTLDASGFVIAEHPRGRPGGMSTWQSFERSDASGHEVDYLNGEVVLLGRLHGVDTPLNEAIQRILGASFAAGESAGVHDVDEVLGSAR